LAIVLAGLFLFSPGKTVQAGEPQEVVRQMLTGLMAVLNDDTLKAPAQHQERHRRIAQVVSQYFDFPEMARRSLDQYWYRLTPAQREEYVQLFSDRILQLLVKRVAYRMTTATPGYGSVPTAIQYIQETIDQAGYASVQTAMTYAHEQTLENIEYLLLRRNGAWLVYDVVAEGASTVTNYRTQFAQIIRRESYDALLQRLKMSQE
jgi:phospholipid transport system substrate-binding protein